ncbi:neugrin [Protopterus annectens]|uniref:neugrin n=1 Tax=Protopterus annectens TaxID=7888 RepID=UPI001CF9F13B|nr:neugrin [Protopterus annectens]
MNSAVVNLFIENFSFCCLRTQGITRYVSRCQNLSPTCFPLIKVTTAVRNLSCSTCCLKGKGSRRNLPDWEFNQHLSDSEMGSEDSGTDPLELAVQEEIRDEKRRQKAILFHRMRREFEPRGPPERTLTWQEIKQIRFLKQELPEEWTVARLAEGFNVSPDIIHRILKSKFLPELERQKKQDSKIKAATVNKETKLVAPGSERRKQLPPGMQQLSASQTAVTISEKHKERSKMNVYKEKQVGLNVSLMTSALQQTTAVGQTIKTGTSASLMDSGVKLKQSKMQEGSIVQDRLSDEFVDPQEVENEIQNEEVWDGMVLCEEELELLAESGVGDKTEVVQKGNEFYDSSGVFLYRI